MFAYCNNNPVNMVDQNGEASTIAQWWTSTMWWLPFADTVLPLGDVIYFGVVAIIGIGFICEAATSASAPDTTPLNHLTILINPIKKHEKN